MSNSFLGRTLTYFILCLFGVGCDGVQPQRVTATGTVSGTDGLSNPTAPEIFTLTHNVGEAPSVRVVTKRILINNVTNLRLAVTRTGIPIDETFALVNISRSAIAPGSSAPQPTVVAGDRTYVTDHVGQIISLYVDTRRVDAPLTVEKTDPFPGRQRSGYTMMARWEVDDVCMPFADPARPIDFSRFQTTLFGVLSTAVTTASTSTGLFSLGGSGDDGDFELYFVPHTQHSSPVDFGTPRNGFTLIFKATIKAGLVEARVYVPLSILFARLPSGGGNASLDGTLDLIQLGPVSSDDRPRVTVAADGAFEQATGDAIRTALLNAVATLPAPTMNTVTIAIGGFSALLNSLRPNGGASPLSENVRVVLFPGTLPPQGSVNRLIPGSLQPQLCILD